MLDTDLTPHALLAVAMDLERAAGRDQGPRKRWGPRTLDIDLLLCDDLVLSDPGPPALTVPHPRMARRAFVLQSLAEIAPGWVVPKTGRTVEQLLEDLSVRR